MAAALFPSTRCHIPSAKHFICGGAQAYVRLESSRVKGSKVIGCVMCLEESFFFFLKYSQLALTSGRRGHPCSKFLWKCVIGFIRMSKHIKSREER